VLESVICTFQDNTSLIMITQKRLQLLDKLNKSIFFKILLPQSLFDTDKSILFEMIGVPYS